MMKKKTEKMILKNQFLQINCLVNIKIFIMIISKKICIQVFNKVIIMSTRIINVIRIFTIKILINTEIRKMKLTLARHLF